MSVCLSVCLCALGFAECSKEQQPPLPVKGVCLCVCNQWACADNSADAVDRLLIKICLWLLYNRRILSMYYIQELDTFTIPTDSTGHGTDKSFKLLKNRLLSFEKKWL